MSRRGVRRGSWLLFQNPTPWIDAQSLGRVDGNLRRAGRQVQTVCAIGGLDFDRHGEDETFGTFPMEGELMAVGGGDEARKFGLSKINLEEPIQLHPRGLLRDVTKIISG